MSKKYTWRVQIDKTVSAESPEDVMVQLFKELQRFKHDDAYNFLKLGVVSMQRVEHVKEVDELIEIKRYIKELILKEVDKDEL